MFSRGVDKQHRTVMGYVKLKLKFLSLGTPGCLTRKDSFSPATSTNVGISPKNFLTFNFNPFATML